MNCTLIRDTYEESGIFGKLLDDKNDLLAVTLEHAYIQPNNTYTPKVSAGVYICKKGQHQLAHMTQPFTAFELQDVPGHTNILIHKGNYNQDSEGCILLGATIYSSNKDQKMITSSAPTFNKFMVLQTGDEFTLTVKDKE